MDLYQKSSKFYHILLPLLIMLVSLCLVSCQRIWYFTIIDANDPTYPTFCISRYKGCRGSGVGFSFLDFTEVDSKGIYLKRVWDIEAVENKKIKEFKYGIAPSGYKGLTDASPLETGTFYRVHGEFYFRFIEQREGEVKAEVYSLEEFNRIFKWAEDNREKGT